MPTKDFDIHSFIKETIQNPEKFLTKDNQKSNDYLKISKHYFDKSKKLDVTNSNLSFLPELYVEGLDLNQVWEQIQLLNTPAIKNMNIYLNTLTNDPKPRVKPENDYEAMLGLSNSDESSDELEEMDDFDEDEEFQDDDLEAEGSQSENDSNEDQTETSPKRKRSEVDDDFFSLEEFEKFATMGEAQDLKLAKKLNKGPSKDDEEEDDIVDSTANENDIFSVGQDMADGLFDDEDNANEIHYDDFFVAPKVAKSARKTWRDDMEPLDGTEELQEDLNEVEGDDPLEEQNEDLNEDADQPMDLLDDEEEEDIDMDKNNLSTFEKQQLKMKAKIDQFETENMAEKDWTLKGEANSKQRPMNSLLEEDLDVDIAVKPVPVITEETTATLADLIIQRIKDMAFDDVVRKAPPKDSVYDPNRRWELDDEKNKKSLAEVYEDEYKKQTSKDEVKTDRQLEVEKQHAEISELYNNLTYQLDALSNWHFTPKPASLEVEVVPTASVPAISLEEVIPANVSNAKLALPREVYDGKVAKSQAELDEKDKKRLRMKAKRIARKEKLEKEKAKQLYQKDDKLSHQVTKDKAMSQLMKQRNVTLVVDSNSSKKKFGKGQAKVIGKTDKIVQEKVKSKPEMLRL